MGVPREDIVLGFQAPYERPYTDFATWPFPSIMTNPAVLLPYLPFLQNFPPLLQSLWAEQMSSPSFEACLITNLKAMYRRLTLSAIYLLMLVPGISTAQVPLRRALCDLNRTVHEVDPTVRTIDEAQQTLESIESRSEAEQGPAETRTYVGTAATPTLPVMPFTAPNLALQSFTVATFRG
ncbi:MAG: element excision factor XisI family protein, partial [Bacteroidota bacterium]